MHVTLQIRCIATFNKSTRLPKQTTRRLPVQTLYSSASLAVTVYPQHHNAWVERHFAKANMPFYGM